MTDRTHPDSGRATGAAHIIRYALELGLLWIDGDGRDKVREALDALNTLEAQLEAIGAGGMSGPLVGRAAPPAAQTEGWISVQDELPKCSKKPDSFGVEVLIWPPHEDGSRTAFYGRRQSREPNFYKYGALLGHVEFWRYPPPPPTSAEGVEHG